MTAKSGKLNHLSAFRGFEKGGAAAPHLSVSLRKLRETPPSRPENRGGGTVSDFVRSSLIHSDNLTINVIDTSVLSKTLFELHKHGVNLNQLMKFCNTYGLDAFNESHVIPTLENERTVFLQTKAALLSLEEEARKGNVMVNLEIDDDMEEEDS